MEVEYSTSAAAIVLALDRILSTLGVPDEMTSDNGPPYNSQELKIYANCMGSRYAKQISYTPWGNGMVENFMKNFGKIVRTVGEKHLNWKQELQKFLRVYRATLHTVTKHTPAGLLFNGRRYKTRISAPTSKSLFLYDSMARIHDAKSKEAMKRAADSKSYV